MPGISVGKLDVVEPELAAEFAFEARIKELRAKISKADLNLLFAAKKDDDEGVSEKIVFDLKIEMNVFANSKDFGTPELGDRLKLLKSKGIPAKFAKHLVDVLEMAEIGDAGCAYEFLAEHLPAVKKRLMKKAQVKTDRLDNLKERLAKKYGCPVEDVYAISEGTGE